MQNKNIINQLEVIYLRSSRTIEVLELSKSNKKKICYIYNYGGYHFRYFDNKKSIKEFLTCGYDDGISFYNEESLDHYLQTKNLNL